MESLKRTLAAEGSVMFSVKVRPQASKTEYKGQLADGTVKIDLKALPEDGKANEELIRFLAKEFGVQKSNVQILSGQISRKKIVRVYR